MNPVRNSLNITMDKIDNNKISNGVKVISIGTDRKLFEEGSAVRKRVIEYGHLFERLEIVVFSIHDANGANKMRMMRIGENITVYPTNSRNKLLYLIDAFLIIRKLIKNSKLKIKNSRNDYVISCQDPFETGIVGAFIKLIYGLPLHIQIHTDLGHKYFRESSLLNKIRFMMSEFTLKYSDRVRVVSERIKKSVQAFSNNIDVLPIRMEVPQGQSLEIKKPFPFTLIMVCRLEKEKNIETIFKAIKKLENKDIGLCLVGDGSMRESLELLAKRLEVGDRILFVGWQNDLGPYYKMADAFISASHYEGYGVSTVEAGYHCLPLILSDTGIAGDIFKNDSALVCDAKDSDCFSQNILKIYEDKNLAQKMGEVARESAQKHLAELNDYYKKYANSVIKTADNYPEKSFVARVIEFKKIAFNSIMFVRYFLCGITAAGFNILLLYLLTDVFGVWYLHSSIIAFILALVLSFVLQKFVVFKDGNTNGMHKQFSMFTAVATLGIVTNTVLVFVFTDILGFWYILSQLFAGFFVMIQNFLLYKYFIFNHKTDANIQTDANDANRKL